MSLGADDLLPLDSEAAKAQQQEFVEPETVEVQQLRVKLCNHGLTMEMRERLVALGDVLSRLSQHRRDFEEHFRRKYPISTSVALALSRRNLHLQRVSN